MTSKELVQYAGSSPLGGGWEGVVWRNRPRWQAALSTPDPHTTSTNTHFNIITGDG